MAKDERAAEMKSVRRYYTIIIMDQTGHQIRENNQVKLTLNKGLEAYLLRSPNPLPVDVKSAVCELDLN